MKKRTPVQTIMTKNVITLNLSDDLMMAEKLFKENDIRHIPVVSGKSIVGMLSYTDLLRISFADAIDEDESDVDTVVYNMFTIEQVMAKNLVTVSPSNTIKEVAEILSKKEFHALPVIEEGELKGIVTTTDLIYYLLEQYN
ncbi:MULTISPECIES: CBS domain-containing protein [Tenacibaculum]|uniref:CBS domain-containing protein n=1 Tax=Tenacibaculum TaxID=104267 RepID=UPI000897881F|nr:MULTISPECIES: CBS domain-containing protein [unclassified Tenacibaculum]RBW56954.1 CBS domain-containing protein [Tenacibaculum sp. E3R01]SED41360.1 CBS domain-containing protein [Tenacibaculum sp. MAR_2010_89]